MARSIASLTLLVRDCDEAIVFFTDDRHRMQSYDVQFAGQPRKEPYGWVVVFLDIYGNKWDLLQSIDVASQFPSGRLSWLPNPMMRYPHHSRRSMRCARDPVFDHVARL